MSDTLQDAIIRIAILADLALVSVESALGLVLRFVSLVMSATLPILSEGLA
jgi:hypothetical protein